MLGVATEHFVFYALDKSSKLTSKTLNSMKIYVKLSIGEAGRNERCSDLSLWEAGEDVTEKV